MTVEYLLIVAIVLTSLAVLYRLVSQKLGELKDNSQQDILLKWLESTQGDMKDLQRMLTQTLQQSDKNITDTLQKSYHQLNQRLDTAAKVIGELKEETGKFTEIGRSMRDLQDFLKSPKLRGNVGEQVLRDLVQQMLPPQSFHLQHRFQSGDIVDVAIITRAGLICIDSKFPLENYLKLHKSNTESEQLTYQKQLANDIRKHVRDISLKYIRNDEKTLDFALMYIPSEAVYYEIMTRQPEVYDYARDKRILPVSPSTFYAFLQTILVSFEGQRIADEAKTILANLRDIQKTAGDFSDKLQVLSRHVTNAHNNMTSISGDFNQLQTKIDSTRSIGSRVLEETKVLDS
jgi:DNA recombination protein RmuC